MGKKKAALAEAFVRDIVEHPDDDAPRLIFADWLDENGDPDRAEFIRVQCRLAALAEDDPQRPALAQREQELLQEHGADWKAEVPAVSGVTFSEFKRGFVSAARLDPNFWTGRRERRVAALFAAAPVVDVTLDDTTPAQLSTLLDHPQAIRLHRLEFFGASRPDEVARRIAASPNVAHLTHLEFFDLELSDPGLIALAASPHLANLTHFLPVDCGPFGIEGVQALAGSPHLTRLEQLYLHLAEPVVEAVAVLAASANFTKLRVLNLVGHLGPAGLGHLAGSPHLTGLHELGLHGTDLGDAGVEILTRSAWRSLRDLDLSSNVVGDEGMRTLAAWPGLASVRALHLRHNVIGEAGIRALMASPYLGQLANLQLTSNPVGPEGVEAILAGGLPRLRELCLWRCTVGDRGARLLADSPASATLADLALANNGITDAGAEALLHSPHLGGLTRLVLLGNPVSEGLRAQLKERFAYVWD